MKYHPYIAKYRAALPQLGNRQFLTDGGMETTLIFHEGWDLPFAEAFVLVGSDKGRSAILDYFDRYLPIAQAEGTGFILESPTWRANPDWGREAGYDLPSLSAANHQSIELMRAVRAAYESDALPIVISGCMGPRRDGYQADVSMSAAEAAGYHGWQARELAEAGVDMISAFTMTNINEAIGIAQAARGAGCPAVISFTVETDGRIPAGETLAEAIEAVDAATDDYPAYYMVNCAHPTHFLPVFEPGARWMRRLKGLRANSSCKSHAELDNSPELDTGDPEQLGREYRDIVAAFPQITVLGGCCGTDHRHIASIGSKCCKAAA